MACSFGLQARTTIHTLHLLWSPSDRTVAFLSNDFQPLRGNHTLLSRHERVLIVQDNKLWRWVDMTNLHNCLILRNVLLRMNRVQRFLFLLFLIRHTFFSFYYERIFSLNIYTRKQVFVFLRRQCNMVLPCCFGSTWLLLSDSEWHKRTGIKMECLRLNRM